MFFAQFESGQDRFSATIAQSVLSSVFCPCLLLNLSLLPQFTISACLLVVAALTSHQFPTFWEWLTAVYAFVVCFVSVVYIIANFIQFLCDLWSACFFPFPSVHPAGQTVLISFISHCIFANNTDAKPYAGKIITFCFRHRSSSAPLCFP